MHIPMIIVLFHCSSPVHIFNFDPVLFLILASRRRRRRRCCWSAVVRNAIGFPFHFYFWRMGQTTAYTTPECSVRLCSVPNHRESHFMLFIDSTTPFSLFTLQNTLALCCYCCCCWLFFSCAVNN